MLFYALFVASVAGLSVPPPEPQHIEGLQSCPNPVDLVSMLVAENTFNSELDSNHTQHADAACPCGDHSKMYWHPTSDRVPDLAYNNTNLAYALDSVWSPCRNVCICDTNDRCYTNQPNENAYVEFVPYCDEISGHCQMYAAPYEDVFDDIAYKHLIDERGVAFLPPNPREDPVGPDSDYIQVKSVSCTGCSTIREAQTC